MAKGVELYGYPDMIVKVASEHIGSVEIGNNNGDYVRTLLRFVGIDRPAQWCTSAAVNILHEAALRLGGESTCPRMASGAKLWRWAMRHPDLCTLIYKPEDVQPGDIGIMAGNIAKKKRIKAGKLASGHTYIVGTPMLQGRYHVTYEGNISLRGIKNQGFFIRTRDWQDPHMVGAIRFEALYTPGKSLPYEYK